MYNRKSVSPRFLLKVDLKKAYDSVSWSFLEEMMIALNFPGQFIGLVMESVRTATYSLVLNGDMFGFFKGKKGLRQGDPLSPLLFTIAMEYLSRVLTYVTDTMKFKYHPLCAPLKLSHLTFADDLLLFSRGDVASIMVLLRDFATFFKASGLLMSPSKTSAYLME
ncbi:secreted RxLR effector protein 78-like [Silene latifolia]|uniref:secreted RxLR effector protein 78-like n=1 Tax=Silene latifolia TaxID=37657 RepID=UPI003D7870D4